MTVQIGAPIIMPCAEHADRLCEHLEGFTRCATTDWLAELWTAYYLWGEARPVSDLQTYEYEWSTYEWGAAGRA